MPKRKRSEDGSPSDVPESQHFDRTTQVRAARLKAKTTQYVKKLHEALKFARAFERQKLGRRQGTANKNRDLKTIQRLKDEVFALKLLDLTKTAENYLLKQYVRTKRIHESPAFRLLYGDNPALIGPKNPAEANVLGRLFKSGPVNNVLPKIGEILGILGLEEVSAKKAAGSNGASSHERNRSSTAPRPKEQVSKRKASSKKSRQRGSLEHEDQHTIDSTINPEDVLMEDDFDENDLDKYDARIAPSDSGEDDENESSRDVGVPKKIFDELSSGAESVSRDISLSPSIDLSDVSTRSPSPEPKLQLNRERRTKSGSATEKPISVTAFLPSLTMGGYFSGSESDAADDINNGDIPDKPRKNRRGQRARQAIHEKKYGKNANHLSGHGNKDGKRSDWDPKRGAVGDDEKGKNRRTRYMERRDRGRNEVTGRERSGRPHGSMAKTNGFGMDSTSRARKPRSSHSQGQKEIEPDRPLHPSWEAAKRKSEQKGGTFAGKKITFD